VSFDHVFWFGDLNYRLDSTREHVDTLIETKSIKELLALDQLASEKKLGHVFDGFTEAEITFLPSYKYDLNTDRYDTSQKKRIPSWADRVLYKSTGQVKPLRYDSVQSLRISDHRPVLCIFELLQAFDSEGKSGRVFESEESSHRTCCRIC
jgi:hypothetical protein